MFSVGNPVDFGKIEERAVDLPIDKIGGGMSVKSTLGRILSWVNPNGISDENRIGIGALEDRIGRADFGRIGGCDRENDQGEAERYALRGSAAKCRGGGNRFHVRGINEEKQGGAVIL